MFPLFHDRVDAGRQLAHRLEHYAGARNVCVLALPRGGVPVGFEVARALNLPLDVFVVRKLGVPGHEELAMGAIATGGVRVLNESVVSFLHIAPRVIESVEQRELAELQRRERLYREQRPALDVRGRTVILVDDGIATGATMRAAVEALRCVDAAKIVVAAPTVAKSTAEEFQGEVDEFVALITPDDFAAVGEWYEEFSPTSDQEVRELLRQAAEVGVERST